MAISIERCSAILSPLHGGMTDRFVIIYEQRNLKKESINSLLTYFTELTEKPFF
jgi:hypothetical protein